MTTPRWLIRRTKADKPITVSARREVVEFYGWDQVFEEFIPGMSVDEVKGVKYLKNPRRGGSKKRPGRQVQISISESKSGTPARKTSVFRVSRDATFRDFAAIAKATEVKWHWMTTPSGQRLSRERWLTIHDELTK